MHQVLSVLGESARLSGHVKKKVPPEKVKPTNILVMSDIYPALLSTALEKKWPISQEGEAKNPQFPVCTQTLKQNFHPGGSFPEKVWV